MTSEWGFQGTCADQSRRKRLQRREGHAYIWRPKGAIALPTEETESSPVSFTDCEVASGEPHLVSAGVPTRPTVAGDSSGPINARSINFTATITGWLAPGSEAERSLLRNGFAVLRGALPRSACVSVFRLMEDDIKNIADYKLYKAGRGSGEEMRPRIINMARLGFGQGEYTYLKDPLPAPLHEIRSALYAGLTPIANRDIRRHRSDVVPKPFLVDTYPERLEAFHDLCRAAEPPQTIPTCLVLHYEIGGHNLPHRDIYGCVSFPYQALCVLTIPGTDFDGGEFYIQSGRNTDDSRQHIPLAAGDLLVFQSSSWHGSEPVGWGCRVVVGLQFHLSKA